jgi:sugar phosphate isomerase/epimerase
MKLAVCNEVFAGWSWHRTCEYARAQGLEGLEIAPFTFAESVTDIPAEGRAEIRRTAADHGLAIVAMHMLLYSPKGLHTNSADAAKRQKAVDYIRALIQFAADVGCPLMVYGSPPTRNVDAGLTYRQARAYMKDSLLKCMDLAARHGVTMCIEPLPGDCTQLFSSVEAALGFVCEVNHPNLGLMVDTKAMSNDVRPVADTIRLFAPEIRHVHANDSLGVAPGFGTLDFRPILEALRQVGYDGWVSLEPFHFRPDAESNVATSLRYLRAILSELGKAKGAST